MLDDTAQNYGRNILSTLNPLNAYRETKIKTASPGHLIIMLYEEAVRQIDTAASLMEMKEKKLDQVNNAILRAQDMITELMVALDFDKGQEIARNLFNLYIYFNQELMTANIQKDPKPLRAVQKMVSELCDAWKQVVAKIGRESGGHSSGNVNIAG